MLKKLLIGFALLLSVHVYGQETEVDSLYDEDEKPAEPLPEGTYRVGMKLGFQTNTLYGGALGNARMGFGLNGGFFLKRQLKGRHFVQTECVFSYRGSEFSVNTDLSNQVSRLKVIYIDFPLLYGYLLDPKKVNRIFIGPYYSALLNSTIFLDNKSLPEGGKARIPKYDLGIAFGGQTNLTYMGFQTFIKIGLLDLNQGIYPGVSTQSGKKLSTFALEFNLTF